MEKAHVIRKASVGTEWVETSKLVSYGTLRKHFLPSLTPWEGQATDVRYRRNVRSILEHGFFWTKKIFCVVIIVDEETYEDDKKINDVDLETYNGDKYIADGNKRLVLMDFIASNYTFLNTRSDDTPFSCTPLPLATWKHTERHARLFDVVSEVLEDTIHDLARDEVERKNMEVSRVKAIKCPGPRDPERLEHLPPLLFRVPADNEYTRVAVFVCKDMDQARVQCHTCLLDNNADSMGTGYVVRDDEFVFTTIQRLVEVTLGSQWRMPSPFEWKSNKWPSVEAADGRTDANWQFTNFVNSVLNASGLAVANLVQDDDEKNSLLVEESYWKPEGLDPQMVPQYLRTLVSWISIDIIIRKLTTMCCTANNTYHCASMVIRTWKKLALLLQLTSDDEEQDVLSFLDNLSTTFSIEKIKMAHLKHFLYHPNAMKYGTPVWKSLEYSLSKNFKERFRALEITLQGTFWKKNIPLSWNLKAAMNRYVNVEAEKKRVLSEHNKGNSRSRRGKKVGAKRKADENRPKKAAKDFCGRQKRRKTKGNSSRSDETNEDNQQQELENLQDDSNVQDTSELSWQERALTEFFMDILGSSGVCDPSVNAVKLRRLADLLLPDLPKDATALVQPAIPGGPLPNRADLNAKDIAKKAHHGFSMLNDVSVDVVSDSAMPDSRGPSRLVVTGNNIIHTGTLIGFYGVASHFCQLAPLMPGVKYLANNLRNGPREDSRSFFFELPEVQYLSTSKSDRSKVCKTTRLCLKHPVGLPDGGACAAVNSGCGDSVNAFFTCINVRDGHEVFAQPNTDCSTSVEDDENHLCDVFFVEGAVDEKSAIALAEKHLRLALIALKDISPGDEILAHYRKNLWFLCRCPTCKKLALPQQQSNKPRPPAGMILSIPPVFQVVRGSTSARHLLDAAPGFDEHGMTDSELDAFAKCLPSMLLGESRPQTMECREARIRSCMEAYEYACKLWLIGAEGIQKRLESIMVTKQEVQSGDASGEDIFRYYLSPSERLDLAHVLVAEQSAIVEAGGTSVIAGALPQVAAISEGAEEPYGPCLDLVTASFVEVAQSIVKRCGCALAPDPLSCENLETFIPTQAGDAHSTVCISLKELSSILMKAKEQYITVSDAERCQVSIGRKALLVALKKKKKLLSINSPSD